MYVSIFLVFLSEIRRNNKGKTDETEIVEFNQCLSHPRVQTQKRQFGRLYYCVELTEERSLSVTDAISESGRVDDASGGESDAI